MLIHVFEMACLLFLFFYYFLTFLITIMVRNYSNLTPKVKNNFFQTLCNMIN